MRFVPLEGALEGFRLHVLLAPHLADRASGNSAWVGEYRGAPRLFAERDNSALALACSAPWFARSAGFVGCSHGWMELGFGPTATEAGQHAIISLMEDFDATRAEYVRAWRSWHKSLKSRGREGAAPGVVRPECRRPAHA